MALVNPRKVQFSKDVMDRMWEYVEKQVDNLLQESQVFRTTTLPEWTRLLKGIPKDKTRNFPFENAANLVVQLIATRVEQLLARAMIIYSVDPLWAITALGDLIGQEGEDQARVLEQFMADMAMEPDELDLYRQEELMFHDGIAYGTSFMYFPWQYITEEQHVGISGEDTGLVRKDEFKNFVSRDSPNPETVPLEDILISNRNSSLEKAKFIARRVRLTREAVEDRVAFGVWTKEAGDEVLKYPYTDDDAASQDYDKQNKGIDYSTQNKYGEVYMIYECWFKFLHDGMTFSIKADWSKHTKKRLNATFNPLPKNMLPLEDLRFGYDTRNYLGYGLIEMLMGYQHEESMIHNNRLDNETIRNNVTLRINKDSELVNTLKFYPGVGLPADKDEVEFMTTGTQAVDNLQSEQSVITLTNERSGIDPASGGAGGGIVNPKRGIYSNSGTLAVLQQQNNRSGLRIMDVRRPHVKIGKKLLDMYAHIGIGDRVRRYGEQGKTLTKALDAVRRGNLGLLLKASNAASNIETDRQNSILLTSLQEKYIGTVNQLLQAIEAPQTQPEQRKFLIDTLFAEQTLTRHIFRIFGHYDVDKLVPFPESIKNERFQQQQQTSVSNQSQQGATTAGVPTISSGGAGSVPASASGQPQG